MESLNEKKVFRVRLMQGRAPLSNARRVLDLAVIFLALSVSPCQGASTTDTLISVARARHGIQGERAAQFLVDHMPLADRNFLEADFLIENLELAFAARAEFPWSATVPEELFLNDVLPYAVFDEKREPWRQRMYGIARELVSGSASASEAVQRLNRDLFNKIEVHYSRERNKPNQSWRESEQLGFASCTGLTIILVQACRAVGIPARAVGTPMWSNQRGNHTWIEIWDGSWHYTGADEYDPLGLDRGWFSADAAAAISDDPKLAIYATTWKKSGLSFPMVWAQENSDVAAINVTDRYASSSAIDRSYAELGVRLWERKGGNRIEAQVKIVDADGYLRGEGVTKGSTFDLNDLARFRIPVGLSGWLEFEQGGEIRVSSLDPQPSGTTTYDYFWSELTPVRSTSTTADRSTLNRPLD